MTVTPSDSIHKTWIHCATFQDFQELTTMIFVELPLTKGTCLSFSE
jgi:hypothetical protein